MTAAIAILFIVYFVGTILIFANKRKKRQEQGRKDALMYTAHYYKAVLKN